ncbi:MULTISPECIES: hypothetical protein [unclassified Phenylobacterium]|uniref:hypothetical protein n=1 Tax=unclassified Phenylobacterium TaxID=2640670 RepID=UPI000839D8C2|nr:MULTISPECIES: hypothetical protein [unclassified Phenylobacterium]
MAEYDWDALSQAEGDFMQQVLAEMDGAAWARPLVEALEKAGGICRENKSFLFELRFARALMLAGLEPAYEVQGEGLSTIDFGVTCQGQAWRIELLRLAETKAAIAATREENDEKGAVWSERVLSSHADDMRQSTEGETLKAIERICQKCERNGAPHKFPIPDGAYNVLLVDVRTFLHGGDVHDRLHIALGADHVAQQWRLAWEGKPITGVFDSATTLKGAKEARERLHFVGFVNETKFGPGSMADATQLVANPHLFETAEDAKAAVAAWPLPKVEILNLKL